MENSLNSLVQAANSVLILLPTKPYLDQVAAGLSLYLAIQEKKETVIYSPSPMLVQYNRLVGVNKVSQELGNKNLVIKFSDYKASDIERVSYDIENGEFKLTVVPKPGFQSPKKEQVSLNYSGVAADLIILIGGADESHFPALASKDLAGSKLAHVGTRDLVSPKSIISLSRPSSSVSEIAAGLIKESGWEIDADIATNLLNGIESGSREFSGPEVSAETFALMADLLRAGGQRMLRDNRQLPKSPQGNLIPTEPSPKDVEQEKAPKDWLEPKIYKGTSVS